MEPSYTFDAHYDGTLVRRAAWAFVIRRFGRDRKLWIVFAVGEVAALAWSRWLNEPWAVAYAIGLPILVAGLFAAVWLSHRRAALARMQALDALRATFTFDEGGLSVSSRAGSATWTWPAITDVWTYPDFWIVALAVNSYFTVPIATAPAVALDYARSKLAGRILAVG